jgi:hypothetical protein
MSGISAEARVFTHCGAAPADGMFRMRNAGIGQQVEVAVELRSSLPIARVGEGLDGGGSAK